jgi:Flp pilus assembly protein TadD
MSMATADELYDRGIDLFSEGRMPEAIAAYREALALDPTHVDALHGLAMACAENGDLEGAIDAARRATVAAPNDPLGYTSLSMFLQRSGRVPEAEAAAAEARIREWRNELKGEK